MNQNTTIRASVIEQGVKLEAAVSSILAMIMDIQPENSLSFGSKNMALSFNSKINLLVDLEFVPKDVVSDFQMFAEIRNKFAHVYQVDNFSRCFEVLADKKNKFLKLLEGETVEDSEEVKLATCFEILCFRIFIWLRVVTSTMSKRKHQDFRKTAVVEMLRSYIEMTDTENGEAFSNFLSTVIPVVKEIDKDQDFMEAVEAERKKLENEV